MALCPNFPFFVSAQLHWVRAHPHDLIFFFFFINLFIDLFLTALGLFCCVRASHCGLVVEHGL